jgi:Transposase DDE domain
MSDNHTEYVGYKRLLESKFLKLSFFKDALFNLTKVRLNRNQKYLVVIDGSEIRKPCSKQSDKLQGVRALNGNIVRGYRSTGTVIISEDNSEVYLFDQEVFSSKEKKYKSDNDYAQKAIKHAAKLPHNLVFVLDRYYDSLEMMTYINNLNREFIVRVSHKDRKVSYLTKPIKTNLPLKQEVKDRLAIPQVMITDIAAFPIKNEFRERVERIKLKKGTFFNVSVCYRHLEVTIENKLGKNVTGTVIEVTLKKDGNLFKESMLLFTNRTNLTEGEIKDTYYKYLQRFGIEQVFKFLKTTLNLEKFQTQDFESIKKLIAITFFTGAYMYCNKQQALDNPVFKKQITQICYLGCGKGLIGLKYLKQGLEQLLSSLLVSKWQKENSISDDELIQMAKLFGLDMGLEKC